MALSVAIAFRPIPGCCGGLFFALGSSTDVAIEVWRNLPDDIRTVFPPRFIYGFGIALIVGGVLSKFYVQRKLSEARESRMGQEGQPGVQGEGE